MGDEMTALHLCAVCGAVFFLLFVYCLLIFLLYSVKMKKLPEDPEKRESALQMHLNAPLLPPLRSLFLGELIRTKAENGKKKEAKVLFGFLRPGIFFDREFYAFLQKKLEP